MLTGPSNVEPEPAEFRLRNFEFGLSITPLFRPLIHAINPNLTSIDAEVRYEATGII
jgi:hypothetical protein